MDINERVSILMQAAELAQKSGVLSLDDAYAAKTSIDACQNGNGDINAAISNLSMIAEIGQKHGVYTLKDAYYIYQAVIGESGE